MKVNVGLNKSAVVDYLCSNYDKFNWERDGSSFDINMSVGNYMYRLGTTRGDERYLQVTAKGSSCGINVSANECKTVDELYDLVWEYTNLIKQDKQWRDILNDLTNHC